MKKSDQTSGESAHVEEKAVEAMELAGSDASSRAVSIGRVIDRLCRIPGCYQITIVVPAHRRAPWQVTYCRVESLRNEQMSGRG